ncbi:MAG TPA: hypothetical protein VHY19_11330 [Steroidobacteraceae bacterium]|jgi:hypothetical protein|nr:hypothetical protein [Steroidobacteraceae bacterium]
MKNFMAVFTGSATSEARAQWDRLDEQERKRRQAAGMKAWQEWMVRHESVLVEGGGPLGKTKRISREGIADTRNNLAAYVLVRADSHQAAAQLFEGHPHFSIFPGDAVEVMECLPVPKG